nr:hypothetical protein [Aeromonas allosaccharophila]
MPTACAISRRTGGLRSWLFASRNGRRCWPTQWSKPTTGSSAVSTVLRSVFAMQRSQTKRGWCVTP